MSEEKPKRTRKTERIVAQVKSEPTRHDSEWQDLPPTGTSNTTAGRMAEVLALQKPGRSRIIRIVSEFETEQTTLFRVKEVAKVRKPRTPREPSDQQPSDN